MEYKSLKIDSDLHEKLKELADDKHTSMQNLIENKLTELIEHEEDILFSITDIKYNQELDIFNINLNKESLQKLITFFEIFLTNRNLKNVNEIENLLKTISYLKSNMKEIKIKDDNTDTSVDTFKNAYNDFKLKIEEMELFIKSDTTSSISIMSAMTKLDNLKEQFLQVGKLLNTTTDYIKDTKIIEDKEKEIEKETVQPIDVKEYEEKYKESILNEIKKFDLESFKNKENEKKLELEKARKIEEDAKLAIDYPMVDFFELKIGDIIRDDREELEYELIKICNNININAIAILSGEEDFELTLKCISPILKDNEININISNIYKDMYSSLRRYSINNESLIISLFKKDSKYSLFLSSIRNIKSLIIETVAEYDEFSKNYAVVPIELLTNLDNLNNAYQNNLTYEEMENILKDGKIWITKAETELKLNGYYWNEIK